MTQTVKQYIKKLIKAGKEYDKDQITHLLENAKKDAYELSLNVLNESSRWEPNGYTRTAILDIDYELRLADEILAKWSTTYGRLYTEPNMGNRSWVEEFDTDIPSGITDILEVANIDIDEPNVPEDESLDEYDYKEEEDEDNGEDDDEEEEEDNLTAGVTYKSYDYKTSHDYDSLLVKANNGDAEAQLLIGHAYEEGGFLFGRDFEQDYVLAAKYYRMSAELGNSEAMYQLGVKCTGCYNEEGEDIIAEDDDEVVKWITLAAENGHIGAQNYLGSMYRNGNYIEENLDEAIKWFKLAAAQGHVYSQTYLGYMYNIGEGVVQDYSEAMKWTKLAAAQGNTDAQFNIGWMYYHGHGVPVNKKLAKKWYRIACKNGHEIAAEHLWEFKDVSDEDD